VSVEFVEASIRVILDDGREISTSSAWFPLLRDASDAQRANWRLFGDQGVHWPDLYEDVSVNAFLGLPT
jgi:hypothetical protein